MNVMDISNSGGGNAIRIECYNEGAGLNISTSATNKSLVILTATTGNSASVIDITNSGSGYDIDGNASNWYITKAGALHLNSNATVGGNLSVTGSASVGTNLTVGGSATISGKLTVIGGVDPDYMQLSPQKTYDHIPVSSLFVDGNDSNQLKFFDEDQKVWKVALEPSQFGVK